MRRFTSFLTVALCAALLLPLAGAISYSNADDAKVDPQADKIIREASEYLRGRKNTHAHVQMEVIVKGLGQDQENKALVEIVFAQPNRVSLALSSENENMVVVSDGEQLLTYDKDGKRFSVEKAPKDLAKSQHPVLSGLSSSPQFAAALPLGDLHKILIGNSQEAKLIGIEELNDVKVHKLQLVQEQADLDVWVEAGERPVVHKIVMNMLKQVPAQARGPESKLQMTLAYTDWTVDGAIDADTFKIAQPEDAEKVDSIFGSSGADPQQLVGKPAPQFKLELLGGGELDLAKHKDKNVVILDFWATWCGPCRRALPTMEKVANQYKEKGVAFYAVNLQERPEQVTEFIKGEGFKFNVAMDVNGKVAQMYLANAIPQTVIIGKDGTVQVVHVGLLPNLEEQLTEELDALIAGKNLADPGSGDE